MVEIKYIHGKFDVMIDGHSFFIKGIGGNINIELASKIGANALRTWDSTNGEKILDEALKYNMKVMLTLGLEKDNKYYFDESYKEYKKQKIYNFVKKNKNKKSLLFWNLGNEINLGETTKEAWLFIEELAQMIKKLDPCHPVTTVIAWAEESALNSIQNFCPSIDAVGINAYAKYFEKILESYRKSLYTGPIMITEWGTVGHWEAEKTEWGAPLEPSGFEKTQLYLKCYEYIINNRSIILGSFVFYWGQKQEITPTWYSIFSENIQNDFFRGRPTTLVKVLGGLWNDIRITNLLEIKDIKINGRRGVENIIVFKNNGFEVNVLLTKTLDNSILFFEIQEEEKIHGNAGVNAVKPRIICRRVVNKSTFKIQGMAQIGEFRLLIYIIKEDGTVGTANIPFRVIEKNIL